MTSSQTRTLFGTSQSQTPTPPAVVAVDKRSFARLTERLWALPGVMSRTTPWAARGVPSGALTQAMRCWSQRTSSPRTSRCSSSITPAAAGGPASAAATSRRSGSGQAPSSAARVSGNAGPRSARAPSDQSSVFAGSVSSQLPIAASVSRSLGMEPDDCWYRSGVVKRSAPSSIAIERPGRWRGLRRPRVLPGPLEAPPLGPAELDETRAPDPQAPYLPHQRRRVVGPRSRPEHREC